MLSLPFFGLAAFATVLGAPATVPSLNATDSLNARSLEVRDYKWNPHKYGVVVFGMNGYALDVKEHNIYGGELQLWQRVNYSFNQQFYFNDWGGISVAGTQSCLDANSANPRDGDTVRVWACNSRNEAQKFDVYKASDGKIVFRHRKSGRCIDVPYGQTYNSARVQLWWCPEGGWNDNQKFWINQA